VTYFCSFILPMYLQEITLSWEHQIFSLDPLVPFKRKPLPRGYCARRGGVLHEDTPQLAPLQSPDANLQELRHKQAFLYTLSRNGARLSHAFRYLHNSCKENTICFTLVKELLFITGITGMCVKKCVQTRSASRQEFALLLSIKKRSTFERRLWAAAGPYCPKDWGL
jgi:hypothetical protein